TAVRTLFMTADSSWLFWLERWLREWGRRLSALCEEPVKLLGPKMIRHRPSCGSTNSGPQKRWRRDELQHRALQGRVPETGGRGYRLGRRDVQPAVKRRPFLPPL